MRCSSQPLVKSRGEKLHCTSSHWQLTMNVNLMKIWNVCDQCLFFLVWTSLSPFIRLWRTFFRKKLLQTLQKHIMMPSILFLIPRSHSSHPHQSLLPGHPLQAGSQSGFSAQRFNGSTIHFLWSLSPMALLSLQGTLQAFLKGSS